MIDYGSGCSVTDLTADSCATENEVWVYQDRLGSTVLTADSAGSHISTYRYSPYGQSGNEGDGGFPFRFTGQKLDPETGLYYYKARYYDPETGRFLQVDPIGYEDQMNLYGYVANDPINFTDPTGEKRDPLENRKRHEEAVQKLSGRLKKQGYKVQTEVRMTVDKGNGKTATRVMDIMATPKGGDIDDARFIEVKTVKEGSRNRNKLDKAAKKANRPGRIKEAASTAVRGAFLVNQMTKDEAIFERGASIQRSGEDAGARAVEWAVVEHDGKKLTRELPIFKIIPPSDGN